MNKKEGITIALLYHKSTSIQNVFCNICLKFAQNTIRNSLSVQKIYTFRTIRYFLTLYAPYSTI